MQTLLEASIGKLNRTCRAALEQAAALCVAQTHYNVEIEHLLRKLLDRPFCDVHAILEQGKISPAAVAAELDQTIERFRRGASRVPSLSPQIPRLLQDAWLISSLELSSARIRSGAILLALFDEERGRVLLCESAPSLRRLPREGLRAELPEIVRRSEEEERGKGQHGAPDAGGQRAAGAPSGGPAPEGKALDRFTIDLTARARQGELDPIRGRDAEIRQVVDVLLRRRQNNPILTGEAGVGKTAVVEGLAQRVAEGDVPQPLRGVSVRVLDLGLLQAGAGVKGEFEARLKAVIAEVQAAPAPVILFIDEAHTIIGAGASEGQGDAANLLKPALARGELRTIAATTWAEYKRYFEKDPALTRRFQVVKVGEPDEASAVIMLRGVAERLAAHHGVRVLDGAVRDAVRLSQRYLPGRQLPDKAVSVLDTACARVALGQGGTPAQVEDARRRLEALEAEQAALLREAHLGASHGERLAALGREIGEARALHRERTARWESELELVRRLQETERALSALPEPEQLDAAAIRLRQDRADLFSRLLVLQGEEPMVPLCVDARVVCAVLAGWTGVPIGRMLSDEHRAVAQLEARMNERVIGQAQAIEALCKRIRTARAGLDDPRRPIGAFLLVGPSGVGKTETALALCECLYGSRNLVVINMSEYQEAYRVSLLKGSPPGYVGYGKGGVLTEAVRRNPYALVLLDEVEKAHPDVLEIFYQVFDKGVLEDGEGVQVDFKNTILLLTSNLGADRLAGVRPAAGGGVGAEDVVAALRPALLKHFPPALLGRLVTVPYYGLGPEQIAEVARLKLAQIQRRFEENHRAALRYAPAVLALVAARCTEAESGARNVDAVLTGSLLPGLADAVLLAMAQGRPFSEAHVGVGEGGFTYELREPPPPPPLPSAATPIYRAEEAAAQRVLQVEPAPAPARKPRRAAAPRGPRRKKSEER